jgi:signal transduction histidine kinase
VLPIPATGEKGPAGVLVVGLSPFRRYDASYRGFLELIAGQIGAAIANAEAYEAERARAEALAEIDRAKTLFFSNVSHEFRTPLTLMLGPLEDALAKLAAHRRQRTAAAGGDGASQGAAPAQAGQQLLDFSRIEAGRIEARYEPTDLAAFTAELASGFRSAVDRAGLRLVIDCAPLPQPVYVDRDMWEKLVLNLISNAFKFTLDGEIEIEIAIGLGEDGAAAVLTVRDTGSGIAAAELPRLFERFHRIEGAKGRSIEGSGIGLALVQELVKLHGGAIRVASEVGRGSIFTVSLPLGTAHLPADRLVPAASEPPSARRTQAYVEEALRWLPRESDRAAAEVIAPPSRSAAEDLAAGWPLARGHGRRVLLADDNADMRGYLSRLLVEQGYVVEAVADGAAALAAARRAAPDLMLSDVMMPQLDGFGLLRALRDDPVLREVPVMLLSARAGEEADVEGLDAGADDYLTKPFSARELLARISTNLQMARLWREAAEALRARTEELEALIATVPTAVWFTHDVAAARVRGNRQAAAMMRLSEESNFSLTGPTDERPKHVRLFRDGAEIAGEHLPIQRAACGEEVRGEEFELRFDDGTSTIIVVQATPLRNAAGAVVGAVAAASDISAQKQAQEVLRDLNAALEQRVVAEMSRREQAEAALRQAQKMEAIGQLTGGVAHDFNNLLLVIQGNLEALERQVARAAPAMADPLARPIRSALRGVERATTLNHRLLAFARRQPLAPEAVDANRLVGGMSELLHRTLGESIEIETVLASGLWRMYADPNQLENAILNLAVNARDAMPEGGKLTIETANSFLDETYAARHHDIIPGQYVAIAVSDAGTGMSKEAVEKAFEPFYTTKAPGKGTGLGLSQVYGFAKQSGGHAKIYSEPGQGTTVRLYLPRFIAAPGELPERGSAQEPATPRGADAETILVVEDDEDVRANSVRSLCELGYRVLAARDGPEALGILEREPAVRLIFTDVGLPGGMNGRQIADEARRRRPGLRVPFTSGYARNAIVHHGHLDPGVELIVKPYTFAVLAKKMRAALDGGA